ncbi:MAG: malectin domain-containing carbohydrate-binding protein [Armatimonadota bacterium]
MKHITTFLACLTATICITTAQAASIVTAPTPSPLERLAASELQRYLYLRTGSLPAISTGASQGDFTVLRSDRVLQIPAELRQAARGIHSDQFIIRTRTTAGRRSWWIIGGSDIGTLYGVYRFAEKLGVRFYLHGDVIPDERLRHIPNVNETGKPVFDTRGIQPFHDFSEGPDWWSTDDYLSYITQLAKMRMNFIGLHCYPEGMAEPAVWIGLPEDVGPNGKVKFSYPSTWANTAHPGVWWNVPMNSSEFTAGAGQIFDDDIHGSEAQKGMFPLPSTPEQYNRLFNNTADMFHTAFDYAHSLVVKSCIGTETPITIPSLVKQRIVAKGQDPADPLVVQEVYKGIFSRIAAAYPVDYYWLWTPERWTWEGNSATDTQATVRDVQSALDALRSIGNPFKLATSGWVLGPVQDRLALDRVLPKDSPMSCINRNVGHSPVEPSFGELTGRPKWAIPWMENDPVLTAPQPWVGRMLFDAADAARLGCTGLLGIHWRTKVLSMNVSALAGAAWNQDWNSDEYRALQKVSEPKDGPVTGQVVTYGNPIEGTDEDDVYQSVRYNLTGYRLAVPNGRYTVRLMFSELAYDMPGRRVFGVSLQGKPMIDRLDIFEKVGKNKALDYAFADVAVTNRQLRLDFSYIVEFPCINGIVISGKSSTGAAYTRKINCGGPALRGYEGDLKVIESPAERRGLPVRDFYLDYARANFGSQVAASVADIFTEIDGLNMPAPVALCPGGLVPNGQPWDTEKLRYAFVDKLEALRPRITNPGDRERYDYWLNTYRYARCLGELGCRRAELDALAGQLNAETDAAKRTQIAQTMLAQRINLSRLWERTIGYQLAAVDTPGEMGTIDNLERHNRGGMKFLSQYDEVITKALGSELPEEIALSTRFTGVPRIIVPTVRTQAGQGEVVRLKVFILADQPAASAMLYWRPLGKGAYHVLPLKHVVRSVYMVDMPSINTSYEYYIVAEGSGGKLVWPATAPRINQSVVVW